MLRQIVPAAPMFSADASGASMGLPALALSNGIALAPSACHVLQSTLTSRSPMFAEKIGCPGPPKEFTPPNMRATPKRSELLACLFASNRPRLPTCQC